MSWMSRVEKSLVRFRVGDFLNFLLIGDFLRQLKQSILQV